MILTNQTTLYQKVKTIPDLYGLVKSLTFSTNHYFRC